MQIKAVLFDLDNTLIDRQRIFKEMLIRKIGEYHKDINQIELEKIVDEIITWDNNGNQNRKVVFQQYIDKYKVDVTADELNAYWNDHSGEFVYIFDDAEDTLLYLKEKYKLGIVSNGNTISQRRKLNKLPFLDLFDYTIVSGEIGIHKPDVGIFNKVCEDMSVLPQECVFVGDNYRCDIEGSYNAGMKPVWIRKTNETSNICDCVYELSELKQML